MPRASLSMARVVFLPKVGFLEWLGLLNMAHVMLDTFPFGAYTSTLEAFSCCGTPVVTLPSAQTKMLTAHAVYAELGIEGLVAGGVEEYVRMAVRVASDGEWLTWPSTGRASGSGRPCAPPQCAWHARQPHGMQLSS